MYLDKLLLDKLFYCKSLLIELLLKNIFICLNEIDI